MNKLVTARNVFYMWTPIGGFGALFGALLSTLPNQDRDIVIYLAKRMASGAILGFFWPITGLYFGTLGIRDTYRNIKNCDIC